MTRELDHAWLCRTIIESSPVAILFADREGKIRLWNGGAEAMFGHSAGEALGQSLDLIIPERQRARHWEGWEKVMATGVTRYGRDVLAVPAVRKDGTRISIEFYILLLRAPDGEILGATALIQDVTARWQQQKELKARLAVLEAKT
jgi:PAS domain S-box-containing protein